MAYSIFNTRAAYTSCIKLRTSDVLLYVMSAGGTGYGLSTEGNTMAWVW